MTFANTRQNQTRPSKAKVFAESYRRLKPKDLNLQLNEMLGNKRNPNCVNFRVEDNGDLVIQDWTFSPKDALKLAAWITENFK